MPFPQQENKSLQQSAPNLITSGSTIAVPSAARFLHAYLIGGGGSGGVSTNSVNSVGKGAGGGCGGAAYLIADLSLIKGSAAQKAFRVQSITLTIGLGGTLVSTAGTGVAIDGNPGGSTTLTFDGTGMSATVTGGNGGIGSTSNLTSQTSAGSLSGSFSHALIFPGRSAVWAWRLNGGLAAGSASITSDSSSCVGGNSTTGVASSVANGVGMSSSGVILPWWIQACGLTLGSGGSGLISASNKVSGGGGGGFSGNGGNGAASNAAGATATAGTGYGSGGGGAVGIDTFTVTSGAGAPGCAVIFFDLEV